MGSRLRHHPFGWLVGKLLRWANAARATASEASLRSRLEQAEDEIRSLRETLAMRESDVRVARAELDLFAAALERARQSVVADQAVLSRQIATGLHARRQEQ